MRILKVALALACVMWAPASARGADAERGGALYEARCDPCHSTSVHVREARRAVEPTFSGDSQLR